MERRKKRRRRLLVLFILAAVMIWIGGCAVSKPLSLSSFMSIGSKPVVNAGTSEQGPQTEAGKNNGNEFIVVGNTGSDNEKPGPGHSSNGETSVATPNKPDTTEKDKPDPPATEPPEKPAVDKSEPIETEKPVDGAKNKCEKCIALTFDDGPDSRYTTAILDILKEKKVKATFFVVGLQVSKFPEVLKRIDEEGHSIGNHTYNHKDLSKLSKEQILKEMTTADAEIEKAIGYTPTLFRAPYGAVNDALMEIMKEYNRESILWNIDTRDWAGTSAADMQKMIKKQAKPNGIILMHSFGGKKIQNTVDALPGIIDELEEMGYTLVTIEQLD